MKIRFRDFADLMGVDLLLRGGFGVLEELKSLLDLVVDGLKLRCIELA